MKNQISRALRLALVMLPLASGWPDQAPPPPPVPDLAEAAAVPVAAERLAPAHVRTDGPVGDLIKLANAGVDSSVLLAFATNSESLFNLNADEIIYLKDLGVPSAVVTAILQHDQALKDQFANSNAPLPPPADLQYLPPPPPGTPASAGSPLAPPDYAPPEDYYPPPPDMPEPAFYDSLSPYGNWIQVDGAGLCWQPSAAVVDTSWQPYFDGGHWLYTDCGWYWASDYSWGWAPFHYGRWFHHHRWGWCWAPDSVWGPSWVCWRYTDGYCGWAPLPPGAAYRPGLGLAFRGRRVGADFGFGLGADSFAFVAWPYFSERHLRPWGVRRERADRIYRQSTPVTRFQGDVRTVSNAGLSPEHVAAASHTPVRPVAIHGVNAPVAGGLRADHLAPNGRTLTVFRPSPSDLSRPSAALSRRPEAAALRSPGATPRYESNPAARSFGESRPVPLDPAGRNQALSNTRLSTVVRPSAPAPRTQPAWLLPQTQPRQWQGLPAPRENPRPYYQAPAPREYQVQTYQAPRYSSPAERSRLDSGPVYSASPRANSAPAAPAPAPAARPSPAPAASSGSQPRSERGGR